MGEDKSSVMEHGELGLIVLNGYEEIGKKVDNHIRPCVRNRISKAVTSSQ